MKKPASIGKPFLMPTQEAWDTVVTQKLPVELEREARASATGKSKRIDPRVSEAVSGLVPQGDVRLTANIRRELHTLLKVEAATRRTSIGELLEDLIEKNCRK